MRDCPRATGLEPLPLCTFFSTKSWPCFFGLFFVPPGLVRGSALQSWTLFFSSLLALLPLFVLAILSVFPAWMSGFLLLLQLLVWSLSETPLPAAASALVIATVLSAAMGKAASECGVEMLLVAAECSWRPTFPTPSFFACFLEEPPCLFVADSSVAAVVVVAVLLGESLIHVFLFVPLVAPASGLRPILFTGASLVWSGLSAFWGLLVGVGVGVAVGVEAEAGAF
mmetsp:Transcript_72041/g.157024  ORF Transcript_72041/g.157024 Transcript_72041/m.157024 type:complete len:226 (+) Transcript_72041:1117-1794(+)